MLGRALRAPFPGLERPPRRGGSPPRRSRTLVVHVAAEGRRVKPATLGRTPVVDVTLCNASDVRGTVVLLTGDDADGLLASLLSTLRELGVAVLDAQISTTGGTVQDRFVVTSSDTGGKLADASLELVKDHILAALRFGAAKSGQPLIYGQSAALEVAAIKAKLAARGEPGVVSGGVVPRSDAFTLMSNATSPGGMARPESRAGAMALQDAEALELAAAEMAVAASALVTAEKAALVAAQDVIDADGDATACEAAGVALEALEVARGEAALALERRMAAMEAAIASRRSPKASIAERIKAERLRELLDRGGSSSGARPGQAAPVSGPAMGNGSEIVLQAFGWDSHSVKPSWYSRLIDAAPAIARSGFTAVWMPPPTNSVSEQGYLPRDLYDLNSAYGDEGELRATLRAFREEGVKTCADVVINHRCAHYQNKAGLWNQFGGRLAWDESAVCSGGPFGGTGKPNSGEPYPAAPNIDHSNPKIRAALTEWMVHLRSVGFDGWRFDYVKGYSGEWTREYVNGSMPILAFGEYWDACSYTGGVLDYNQDAHRQRTVNWCDRTGGTTAAFDFTTKACLQEAVSRSEYWRLVDSAGRMPGVAGMWAMRAVTFVENHDTGPPLSHWPFPALELAQGYCYILTHPGTPCVLWSHWDSKAQPGLSALINALVALRRSARITAKSTVVVLKANSECYAACIDARVVMKIGWGQYSPNTNHLEGVHWTRAVEERNCCVWLRDQPASAVAR